MWVCGILNPRYIALGGPALRRECIGPVNDGLSALLPGPMCPELLYSADIWGDYQIGMAWLTAEKIFHMVQIIKKYKEAGPLLPWENEEGKENDERRQFS